MTAPSPILIGVAGGSGSGKTLVTKKLVERFRLHEITVVEQDAYYRDFSALPIEERKKINFDHPDAVDFDALQRDLELLLAGHQVSLPVYDYKRHQSQKGPRLVGGQGIIILEGIMAFHRAAICNLMAFKVFVDTPADIRLIRRIRRDMESRGRALEDILNQYENQVKPMHAAFVEPSKEQADIILPKGGKNEIAIRVLQSQVEHMIRTSVPASFTQENS